MSDENRQRQRQQLWIGVYKQALSEPRVTYQVAAARARMAVEQFDTAFPACPSLSHVRVTEEGFVPVYAGKQCTKCRCERCTPQQPRFPGRFPWTPY